MMPRTPAPLPSGRVLHGLIPPPHPPTTRAAVCYRSHGSRQHVRWWLETAETEPGVQVAVAEEEADAMRLWCKLLKRTHRRWRVAGGEPTPRKIHCPMKMAATVAAAATIAMPIWSPTPRGVARGILLVLGLSAPSQSGVMLEELVYHGQIEMIGRLQRTLFCENKAARPEC
ncbi:hypothetical protein SEVIR_9G326850v4 [Setaria viridis]|uniref:Uncharacterized protein n=1 Tax=Setaria viridis TaxID=4556 RepID=A0A4U6T058_SETVI|nr:hypothetical protein SEVIR_9G326850v2 [Setaria viridis]